MVFLYFLGMPSETAAAICSVIFGGVLEQHPNLKICFAHGGGAFPYLIGRVEHGFNVRPDLCATENTINPRCVRLFLQKECHSFCLKEIFRTNLY